MILHPEELNMCLLVMFSYKMLSKKVTKFILLCKLDLNYN